MKLFVCDENRSDKWLAFVKTKEERYLNPLSA